MTEYELIYILKPDLTEADVKKVREKLAKAIDKLAGKLVQEKDMGKRPLAYRIEKQTKGHYWQLNFEGSGALVDELERVLRLSEEAIRFLTVKRDPNLPLGEITQPSLEA